MAKITKFGIYAKYTLAFVASETESETTAVSHILQTLSLVTKKKNLVKKK